MGSDPVLRAAIHCSYDNLKMIKYVNEQKMNDFKEILEMLTIKQEIPAVGSRLPGSCRYDAIKFLVML
jgi:hypothetical protein